VFSSDYGLVTVSQVRDDGTYRVQCDPGISLLRFEIPGFHPAVHTVSTESVQWHLLDVVMRRATSVIGGTVVDPVGIPVEHAQVVLFSQSESACIASTQTDADGSYQFRVVAGDYVVSAWTSDSVFRPELASVGDNERVEVILAGAPADVRITGRVLDGQGGVVSDAKLCAYTQDGRFVGSTLSDSSGHYSLYLPAGSWEIKAWKDGWTHIGVLMSVDQGKSQISQDIVLLPSDARISGLVVDRTGEPVSNAWIEVTAPDSRDWVATSSTDEHGMFVLDIASGVWDLSLMAEGYHRASVRVDVTATGGAVLSQEPDLASLRLVLEGATDRFVRPRSAQAGV
jgi:protocatechuate 3,4-dioxygenase beta subunit